MVQRLLSMFLIIGSGFVLAACGDFVDRRTIGTAQDAAAESIVGKGRNGGTKKPDSSKKTRTKGGEKVTLSFGLSGQAVSVRPPVHYIIAVDSSESMGDEINQLVASLEIVANEILAARSSSDANAKDQITLMLDLGLYPEATRKKASGIHKTVKFTAANYGEAGNNIVLEFDGKATIAEVAGVWNEAHPENQVEHNPRYGDVILGEGTVKLSGAWEISPFITQVNVSENVTYNGRKRPFRLHPWETLIPYSIEYFQKQSATSQEGIVPHFFIVTDDDAGANQLAKDFLRDVRSQYAFSSWAPYNFDGGECEGTPDIATTLAQINQYVKEAGHLGAVIDYCDKSATNSPELIAEIINSTEYMRWVFPEYYWIGETADFAKPITVKVDGEAMDASNFTVVPESYAIRFNDDVSLIGKSKIEVTFTEKTL